ncbi:hypothetical protein CDAR_535431 [Caerostris darwini]|uniref:Uncharacterized protein n=1 Tax=Caerostris darwini TaxID=1538125 RepID=A0AAV4V1Z6_9ARAC|nr:hypothetical protein CDAR_535431 [Caerostris darwini]
MFLSNLSPHYSSNLTRAATALEQRIPHNGLHLKNRDKFSHVPVKELKIKKGSNYLERDLTFVVRIRSGFRIIDTAARGE